jgi:hypothetical protein
MGKSDFSSWFSSKADDVKEQNKNLTEYDITINTIKHENMFKGTIVICIVYAIFGFIIVLLSYLSESVRDLLFNKFLPFTIVYIFGSILIISLMLYYIFTFEPVKIDRKNDIDDISCPDYWKVEIIDDKYIGDSFDKIYKNDFKYKCVLDKDVFDKSQMFKYHNLNNYRMTNNIGRTKLLAAANLVGSYDSTKDDDFNTDYKNNGKNYNLYVDVNKYKANPSDTGYTDANSKKELSKQLNIYNDSARVNNVLTNLKKIALLENNYSIGKDKSATNLLTDSNILNPTGNFGIWKNNNTGLTDAIYADLNATSSNNNLLLINWNGLEYNFLSNILNETGITSIKVVSSTSSTSDASTPPSGIFYCLGMIKYKSQTDRNIYFEPYYPTALLETIIFKTDGTSQLHANNRDIKNNIITKTFLYKSTLSTASPDKVAYVATTSGLSSMPTSDIFISKAGPILQAYDKTIYRQESYTETEINTVSNQIPLLCDTVYPKLFSKFEKYDIKNENNNDIRCAYSKICGIPWSDLRCNN